MSSGPSSPIHPAHSYGYPETSTSSGSSSPNRPQHPSPPLPHIPPHQSPTASPARSTQAPYGSAHPHLADILVEIQDSKPHQMQLELWEMEENILRELIDQGEVNCSRPLNEIYQLLTFYFVFQGIVFTGVAQSNVLSCKDWWSPFSLSLIALLTALCAVHQKLAALAKAKRDLQTERNRANALYCVIMDMRTRGADFDLGREPSVGTPMGAEMDFCRKYQPKCGTAITVVLVTYAAVIMVTSVNVLCRECKC